MVGNSYFRLMLRRSSAGHRLGGREAGREKATEQPVGRGPGRANPRTLRWEDTWEIRKGGGNCRDYGLRRRTEERAVGDNERNAFRGQILYAALESVFFFAFYSQ